jgi:hypothetical protein
MRQIGAVASADMVIVSQEYPRVIAKSGCGETPDGFLSSLGHWDRWCKTRLELESTCGF